MKSGHTSFFAWQLESKLLQVCVLRLNNNRIHGNMKIPWADCALKLASPSTQRIGKDIRASSSLFTRRVSDVTSEAFSTSMSGDRYEGPKHNRGHSDAIVINMNFNSYSSLARILFFIIPVLFCFCSFFLMDLFDREKKKELKKKILISFVLFYFMYNVPYISVNMMSLTIWSRQISKYTK